MSESHISAPDRRLVTAAEGQFRRFGYRRTTIDDITAEAGTGKGSLYLHFESMQAVYMAVVEASLERFVESASNLLDGSGPVPPRLRGLVEVTIDHYGRDELRTALEGDSQIPLDRALTTLNQIVGLGLLPRSP